MTTEVRHGLLILVLPATFRDLLHDFVKLENSVDAQLGDGTVVNATGG